MEMTTGPQMDNTAKNFKDFLEALPCAAYLVKNDSDLTLLYGNSLFYSLFGGKEDIRYKYGNRLGALMTAQSLEVLSQRWNAAQAQGKKSFEVKQQIKRNGVAGWIFTRACIWYKQEVQYLFCISCDITENESKLKFLCDFAQAIGYVAKQADIDAFEYHLETHATQVLSMNSVLGQVLPTCQGEELDIVEALTQSGILQPDSVAAFQEAFECLGPNQLRSVCELRMKNPEGKPLWVRFTLTAQKTQEGISPTVIGFLENITQQKEAYLNYQNETQFYQTMLTEKDAYAQLDATEDKITLMGGVWSRYSEVLAKKSYSQIMRRVGAETVCPQDRRSYLDLMGRRNFMESLENGIDRLGGKFRWLAAQGKTVEMALDIHLFKDPYTTHTLALVCVKSTGGTEGPEPSFFQGGRGLRLLGRRSRTTGEATPEESKAFEAFLSEQGDLAYLVDPNSLTLLCGNEAFYRRIGLNKAECQGKKCYELVHKRKSPCPFCSRANWSQNKFYLWKNYNSVLEQSFLVKNRLVLWQGKEFLLALLVDISSDKSVMESIENSATESHFVLDGIRAMAAAENLEAVMNSALETIGRFFGASSVHFWECTPSGGSYQCAYTWSKSREKAEMEKDELREADVWLKTAQWEQAIALETPEAMLSYSHTMYQQMKKHNIKNQRWVPLKHGSKERGCISIDNLSNNPPNTGFLDAFTGFMADELQKRRLVEGLRYAYQRDELTDLLSRNSYEKYRLEYSADGLAMIGVVVANFDQLKEINNSKGFHVGNYCIREFANMLREVFPGDAAFRLNGDEFLVIAPNIQQADLEDKVGQLEAKVKDEGTFAVSMGYSWDNVEKDLALLIEQSTQAMKVNKQRHHDVVPDAVDLDRRKMLSELVAALENHEFEIFLQPKVVFEGHTLTGAEALVRYHHKTLGYIPPAQFIEKLEQANLIRYVDLFVFEEVCKVLESWKRQRLALPVVSVNFSRITLLERNIISSVGEIVNRYDVDKKQIEIEITESVSDMGKSILRQATNTLRSAGFSISLDDFGTKYTNMAILSDIDFDVLKLDKSLVGALDRRHSNQVILKNIIRMCRELGISVIAEGVETQEQEALLRRLDCTQGQGYLYGKPMPVEEFSTRYSAVLHREAQTV